jgi:hypothetical protein
MKNSFKLTEEERIALLEKIKSFPRPERFAKQQSEAVVEEETTEEIPVEDVPVTEVAAPKKSKKSKK